MEKFKPFIIPVALLVLIDQMVKIVISKVFMKYEFDIIAKVLRFNPELNTRLSYAGNFFELLSSPFVTILLNVFVLFLFLSGYMLYQANLADRESAFDSLRKSPFRFRCTYIREAVGASRTPPPANNCPPL